MVKDLYSINQASGITVYMQADGSITIDGCILSKNNKQLNIESKISGLTSIDELNKVLPAKTMLALNLSGKGVLTKKLEKLAEVTAANFNLILPNANFEEFYIQNTISSESSFISVIRKIEADKWLKQLTGAGYMPVMLSLGPFPVLNVIGEVNLYGESFVFNGHVISRNERGEWLRCEYDTEAKAQFKLKIQNEAIDESQLLPYAVTFQLILHQQTDVIKANAKPFDDLFISRQVNQKFRTNGLLILGVFFILLLVNFILFSWLESANTQLNFKLTRTLQNTDDIKITNDQIKDKEAILSGLGWDGNTNKSILIDQIAAILPSDVKWTAVDINPVDIGGSQQAKSLVFINRNIKVTGLSNRILLVNEWIARIRTRRWVKNIQLEKYTFDNELNTGIFTLTIAY